jgi:alkanesulfonate monooxygenase SsuD/methylene tetrahydromethanopterin reductase-like flavin-dependent oxidoreductase (luciferase family)
MSQGDTDDGRHHRGAAGTVRRARRRESTRAVRRPSRRTSIDLAPVGVFERYCPCGTPDEVAASLLPYVDAGCRSFNLIPLADSQEQAIDGTEAVRGALGAG